MSLRDRLLAREAYLTGREDMRRELMDALGGKHAATLDGPATRNTIDRLGAYDDPSYGLRRRPMAPDCSSNMADYYYTAHGVDVDTPGLVAIWQEIRDRLPGLIKRDWTPPA